MSKSDDPGSWAGRVFGWCLLVLLAAMALEGAVQIMMSIWLPLTILAAVAGALWLLVAWRGRF